MSFQKFLTRPISGTELLFLFKTTNYANLLFKDRIVFGADTAIEQIEKKLGERPLASGDNISEIQNIRDLLFADSNSMLDLNGLTIIAPHTHWQKKAPVIYSFLPEKQGYVVGPQQIKNNITYTPVSFVFSEEFPLCYEWIDETILLDKREWQESFNIIRKLNEMLSLEKSLFGIAIDFRFRSSLKEEPVSSLELPVDFEQEGIDKDFSFIVNQSKKIERNGPSVIDQVAWHPFSRKFYNFSEDEMAILESIRDQLTAENSVEDREAILKALHERFS